MGAPIRMEDEAFSDERYEDLARFAGLADADHARGKMARLWRQCTLESSYVLPRETVMRILGANGVEALVAARLGDVAKNGVRIRGTKGRIEWLKTLRNNKKFGKLGGRPKKNPPGFPEKPSRVSKTDNSETPLTLTPALTPSPALTPTDTEKSSAPPSAGGAQLRLVQPESEPQPELKQKRKSKPFATPAEHDAAMRILQKLGEQSGVKYTGAKDHIQLIVHHLREGVTEMELRAVISFCASSLNGGWKNNPDMKQYLRPHTLFGARTLSKYLDPARTWLDSLPPDEPEQPKANDCEIEPDWFNSGGLS